MKSNLLLFVAFLFNYSALYSAPNPQNLIVKKGKSEVEFTAIGKPGFLRINGESKQLDGYADLEKGTAEFMFELNTLVTGMDMRDRHMKDNYLEVKKFPNAKLTVANFKVDAKKEYDQDFSGELTLHGVTKPVTGHAKFECENSNACEVEATLTVKLSDYGISIPEYAGITVAEKVDITVETALIKGLETK